MRCELELLTLLVARCVFCGTRIELLGRDHSAQILNHLWSHWREVGPGLVRLSCLAQDRRMMPGSATTLDYLRAGFLDESSTQESRFNFLCTWVLAKNRMGHEPAWDSLPAALVALLSEVN